MTNYTRLPDARVADDSDSQDAVRANARCPAQLTRGQLADHLAERHVSTGAGLREALWSVHQMDHDGAEDETWCASCGVLWPCPTAKVLLAYPGVTVGRTDGLDVERLRDAARRVVEAWDAKAIEVVALDGLDPMDDLRVLAAPSPEAQPKEEPRD